MNLTDFDDYIEETLTTWNCPGAAIVLIKDDQITLERAFGFADLDQERVLTSSTRFPLASVTKSITAMSVAVLVDDGLLEWDKPVIHYMPEFVLHDPYATRYVTLRDMLSHRTGLPRHDLSAWRLDLPRVDFIKRMQYLRFSASFREKFQYNNLMYMATGYLVEKVAGLKWEDFVQDRIFKPLGMTDSNFSPELSGAAVDIAEGYRIERDVQGGFKEHVRVPMGRHTELSPGPAGALFSSLSDMAQWLRVHLNAGQCDGRKIVSKGSLQQMHAPQVVVPTNDVAYALSGLKMMAYGMGWEIRPYPYSSGTLITHGGNVEGHSVVVGFIPETGVGVAVLTNVAGSPVPTILLREAMDRTLELPSKDWSAKFLKLHEPLQRAMSSRVRASSTDKRPDSPATLPLAEYVGTYEADGYPDFSVRMEESQLAACTVGSLPWSEFSHAHFDVFEWHLSIWGDEWKKAKFQIDDTGIVSTVSIALTEGVPEISFKRKPMEVDESTLTQIAGVYDTDIEGLTVTVSVRDGHLYWQQPGGQAILANAYACNENTIEFRLKTATVAFHREAGKIVRFVGNTPGTKIVGKKRDC